MFPYTVCRIMFWSEIGGQAQIARSGMDGSDRKVVVSRGLERPVSVTVDILTDRLYWTDEKAPVYRLGDAGWRKHEGNVKCFKRASTISASLWFLYNFCFSVATAVGDA